MQLSERCAWNKTTTNKKPWKRLQVLIAARSLKKTFLLYVLQSCYTTAKSCVTTSAYAYITFYTEFNIQNQKSPKINKQFYEWIVVARPMIKSQSFLKILKVWAIEILEASKRSIMSFLYVSDIFDWLKSKKVVHKVIINDLITQWRCSRFRRIQKISSSYILACQFLVKNLEKVIKF